MQRLIHRSLPTSGRYFATSSPRLSGWGGAAAGGAWGNQTGGWGSNQAAPAAPAQGASTGAAGWGSSDGGWGTQAPAAGGGGDGWGSESGWGAASTAPPAGRSQGAAWGAPADEGWGAAGGGRGRGNRGGGGFRGGGGRGGGGFDRAPRGRGRGSFRGGGGGGGSWGAPSPAGGGGWGAAQSTPGGWGGGAASWGQEQAGGAGGDQAGASAAAGEWGTTQPSFTETAPRVDPLTLTAVAVEIDGIKKLVGQRVLISGVSDDSTWQSLKDHMRQAAECTFCKIFRGGRAVVAFSTPEEAAKAIQELQGSELEGSTVFLREDRDDIVVVNTKRRIREAREAVQRENADAERAKLAAEQPPLPPPTDAAPAAAQ
jgi:hypothetical protein